MRNVDENIEQKIFLSVGKKEKKEETKKEEKRSYYEDYIFEENMSELNKIKLRLRYSKALGSKFTEEQDEYNYVRSINSSLNIKSKKEYIERKNNHNHFINSPEEYFKSKGVWNNWYDFMGVDTTKFIQSKREWINFCKEKNIKSLDEYFMQCEINDNLPKYPLEIYKDFTNIQNELIFVCSRTFAEKNKCDIGTRLDLGRWYHKQKKLLLSQNPYLKARLRPEREKMLQALISQGK